MAKQTERKPAWRIVAFLLGAAAIVLLWVSKGNVSGMTAEAALTMLLVNGAVTLVKVALMAGAVLLIRWVAGRIGK